MFALREEQPIDPPISKCEIKCSEDYSSSCECYIECVYCGRGSCDNVEELTLIDNGHQSFYLCSDGYGCDEYNKWCQVCRESFEPHEILTISDKKVCITCGILNRLNQKHKPFYNVFSFQN